MKMALADRIGRRLIVRDVGVRRRSGARGVRRPHAGVGGVGAVSLTSVAAHLRRKRMILLGCGAVSFLGQ
jgi:hypothetical protein